jgi:hypothetical protein
MTMKSLLLGAAAGIAAFGAAQAADLPMTKGEAAEYVKACSSFGLDFFYIPDSYTCLKIGGEIRAIDTCVAFGPSFSYIPGSNSCIKIPGKVSTLSGIAGGLDVGRYLIRNDCSGRRRIWIQHRTPSDRVAGRFLSNIDEGGCSIRPSLGLHNYSGQWDLPRFGALTAGSMDHALEDQMGRASGTVSVLSAETLQAGDTGEDGKVCLAFGPGFHFVPGNGHCIKFGTHLRSRYPAPDGWSNIWFSQSKGNGHLQTIALRTDFQSVLAWRPDRRIWVTKNILVPDKSATSSVASFVSLSRSLFNSTIWSSDPW